MIVVEFGQVLVIVEFDCGECFVVGEVFDVQDDVVEMLVKVCGQCCYGFVCQLFEGGGVGFVVGYWVRLVWVGCMGNFEIERVFLWECFF